MEDVSSKPYEGTVLRLPAKDEETVKNKAVTGNKASSALTAVDTTLVDTGDGRVFHILNRIIKNVVVTFFYYYLFFIQRYLQVR